MALLLSLFFSFAFDAVLYKEILLLFGVAAWRPLSCFRHSPPLPGRLRGTIVRALPDHLSSTTTLRQPAGIGPLDLLALACFVCCIFEVWSNNVPNCQCFLPYWSN
jgi:hypothetical protein